MPGSIYDSCLFFVAGRLHRAMNKLAEEAFAPLGIAPTYAYVILALKEKSGLTQKELCEQLRISPSTSTRFLDKLITQKYAVRRNEGKYVELSLTEEGEALYERIQECLRNLYAQYIEVLGQDEAKRLAVEAACACQKLEKST